MPYAPGISFDGSAIGQGIAHGLSQVANAMIQNAAKREEKEKWNKTVAALQPMLDQQTGGKVRLDKDTPKEAIPTLIQFADNLERQNREKPLRDLQMENEQLKLSMAKQAAAQATSDRSALRGAFGTPDPDASEGNPLASYVGAGGADPHALATLAPYATAMAKVSRPGPKLVTLGNDAEGKPVQGVYDGNNFQALKADKAATESQLGKLISERDAYRAAGHADAAAEYDRVIKSMGVKYDAFGNPMTGEAPVGRDPFESEGLPKPANKKERDALPPGAKYVGPDGQVYSVPGKVTAAPTLSVADQQALQWAQANPGDPRSAAILKRFTAGK